MPRRDPRLEIVAALTARGASSRAELARVTGLAESTVSVAVAQLVRQGLAAESVPEQVPGRRGRPPVLVRLERAAGLALGIDVGKRHIRLAVADLNHRVLAEHVAPVHVGQSALQQITQIRGLLEAVLREAGASRAEIRSAAMGLPGPIDRSTGAPGAGTILPGWTGVKARDLVTAELGIDVMVENDSNLGVIGEWTWGAARGTDTAVYLKVSAGVGVGLIVAGEPFRGTTGMAGELGHTVVARTGPRCACGNLGCLETLAGTDAVLRDLGLEPDTPIHAVVARARAGDARAAARLAESGRLVGEALASVMNLLDPDVVVVGGALGLAGTVLLDPLLTSLTTHGMAAIAARVAVVPAHFGDRAEVMGALALALRAARPLDQSSNISTLTAPNPAGNWPHDSPLDCPRRATGTADPSVR